MIKVLASNQLIAVPNATPVEISTDPVPMNGNDRFSAVATVHYVFGGGTPVLTFKIEGSNDGTSWVDCSPTGTAWPTADSATTFDLFATETVFAFLRMKMSFQDTTTGPAFICFDVHALITKS